MHDDMILLTGASGRIGRAITPALAAQHRLRLLDLRPVTPPDGHQSVQADIRNVDDMTRACDGCRAVVHLAAIPAEDDFESRLAPMNLQGVWATFEGARRAGVAKVVFASSAQVIMGYPSEVWVTADMPPRPISAYAATKAFGEALARWYSDAFSMSMLCLRFGAFGEWGEQMRAAESIWLAPSDAARLVLACLQSDVRFGIYHGVSDVHGRHWDVSNAKSDLGWEPKEKPR